MNARLVRRAVGALLLLGVAGAAFVAGRGYRYRAALLAPQPSVPDRAAVADVTLEDSPFTDANGRKLSAWYHFGTRGHVVLIHGFGENRAQLAPEMKLLAAAGWGFLAYDAPGHGQSEGRVGWGDAGDQAALRAAVDALLARPGVDPRRVGALGFSIGGVTLALEAATDPRLHALVVEASYPTLDDEIASDCGRWGALCAWPGALAMKRGGIDVAAVRPIDALPEVRAPVLIVVDTLLADDRAQQRRCFDGARMPKELYEVPGALHGHYAELDPRYGDTVLGFLERSLP